MMHAKYSPSKLSRVLACPGSVPFSEYLDTDNKTTAYAEEGTLLHELTAECLEDEEAINGVAWEDPEHKFLVEQAVQAVHSIQNGFISYKMYQDTRVYMKGIDCNGTLDVGIIGETELGTEVHVIDFKFGGGVEVSAVDNPQGQAYIDGFMNLLGLEYMQKVKMFFWIIQPRMNKVESEQYFPHDQRYFRERLIKAIRLAESKNPPFCPGFAQCRWCPGGGVCKHRMLEVKQTVADAMQAYADMREYKTEMESIENLAKLLRLRPIMSSAFDAIYNYLFTQISRGQKVSGYKLVNGRSSRKWATGVDAFTISDLFPHIDATDLIESKTLSPAKVEKLLTKEERKALEDLIIRVEGEPTMASEDSNKEELKSSWSDLIGE